MFKKIFSLFNKTIVCVKEANKLLDSPTDKMYPKIPNHLKFDMCTFYDISPIDLDDVIQAVSNTAKSNTKIIMGNYKFDVKLLKDNNLTFIEIPYSVFKWQTLNKTKKRAYIKSNTVKWSNLKKSSKKALDRANELLEGFDFL